MKFKYIGDADDKYPRDSVTCWGMTFIKGEPVDVTDSLALSKLPVHPHFERVKDVPKPKKKTKEDSK